MGHSSSNDQGLVRASLNQVALQIDRILPTGFFAEHFLSGYALLLVCGILLTIASFASRWRKQREYQAFAKFARDHGCSQTQRTVRYGFIPSMRNKLGLLTKRKGDLFQTVFAKKFNDHGSTYALYDSYGMPKVVHTIEPENVHAVLSSRSADYGIPEARTSAIGPIKSEGVVMTEGALWAQNRRAINVGFRGARFTDGIERGVQMLFEHVSSTVDAEGWTKPFQFFQPLSEMTLDRSIDHMFGVSSGLQESAAAGEDDSVDSYRPHLKWKSVFDTIAKYVAIRSVLGRRSWLYDAPVFRRACGQLRALCEKVIQTAIQNSRDGVKTKASFIGNLVQETSDSKKILGVVLDLFIAGHNMTAGGLAWLFYELERQPQHFTTMREEILDVFGTESEPKAEMTWENLQKCKKLHNCIYEALRMYPVLPNLGRQALRDTTLPTGGGEDGKSPVAVAKGTVVMCCLYLMHRRGEEWGEEVEEFRPERWENRVPGWEYAPFGGGPRICPGKLFGLVEMFYITARVLQRFEAIDLPHGGPTVKRMGAGVMLPTESLVRLRLATKT